MCFCLEAMWSYMLEHVGTKRNVLFTQNCVKILTTKCQIMPWTYIQEWTVRTWWHSCYAFRVWLSHALLAQILLSWLDWMHFSIQAIRWWMHHKRVKIITFWGFFVLYLGTRGQALSHHNPANYRRLSQRLEWLPRCEDLDRSSTSVRRHWLHLWIL